MRAEEYTGMRGQAPGPVQAVEYIMIACGGRHYGRAPGEVERVVYELEHVLAHVRGQGLVLVLRHGQARGADFCASKWAEWRGVRQVPYPCEWGAESGPARNKRMLWASCAGGATRASPAPDVRLVVAFPGGRGTAHMVRIAREAGVQVHEVRA